MSNPLKVPIQNKTAWVQFLKYSGNVLCISLVLFLIKFYLDLPSPEKQEAQINRVKTRSWDMMAGCRLFWGNEGEDQPCSLTNIKEYFRPDAMVNIKILRPYKKDFLALSSYVGSDVQFKMEIKGSSGILTQIENDELK